MPPNLDPPANLADLLSNPQRVRDAFALLTALLRAEVMLEPPSGTGTLSRGKPAFAGAPPSLQLRLPFQFSAPIGDASNTTASLQAKLNALLQELRNSGINPPGG